VRTVTECLAAHAGKPSRVKDLAMEAGGLGIALAVQAAPETPIRLATAAFSFENLEIAAYSLICGLARRMNDSETLRTAEHILEEEEAAAERIAGTFERTIVLALGDPAGEVPAPH
jgi:ferritin-like metal-binding protein YciE